MKKEITNTKRLSAIKSTVGHNSESRVLITEMEDRLTWYFQELNELINNQAA